MTQDLSNVDPALNPVESQQEAGKQPAPASLDDAATPPSVCSSQPLASASDPEPAGGYAKPKVYEIFDQDSDFDKMGLRKSVVKGLRQSGFIHPTVIQSQLIPLVLAGKDVIGQAKTGSGKTAAFGLPILHLCDHSPLQALILVPTRELAAQVAAEIEELGQFTPIRATCVVGGESMKKQVNAVHDGAHIVVGTPGRVMDLHGRGQLPFNNVAFVVLDEVDRMLDIGFREDIRNILGQCPPSSQRQTIVVSATISDEIEKLGRKYMKPDVVKSIATAGSLTVSMVEQHYLVVEPWDKKQLLLHLLKHEDPATTVVFCRTKMTVHKVATYLKDHGIDAREIHGNLAQSKRNSVMKTMREGNLAVLVASDLAARGLDIDHISHVVNYDLPEDPEVYVHRIGRTARAGRKGVAWAFVASDQGPMLTMIEKLIGLEIPKMDYPTFKPGPLPADVQARKQQEEVRLATPKPPRVMAPEIADLSDTQLAAMFPNGQVPSSVPKRTLASKHRTRRR